MCGGEKHVCARARKKIEKNIHKKLLPDTNGGFPWKTCVQNRTRANHVEKEKFFNILLRNRNRINFYNFSRTPHTVEVRREIDAQSYFFFLIRYDGFNRNKKNVYDACELFYRLLYTRDDEINRRIAPGQYSGR